MKLWIGTSGWQYAAWKGGFYPDKISAPKMLPYYAERFNTTEINYTFRHLPTLKSIENWSALTPPDFAFSFKASQRITHFAKLRDCAESLEVLGRAITPMGPKTAAVLFQLPPSLQKDVPLLSEFLAGKPTEMRAAFEFRHASWFTEEVYEALQKGGAALCLAEDEKLATPTIATAGFGYLRLRREDYTQEAIVRWGEFILGQADRWSDAFIYFKHEDTGVGPKFGKQLQEILHENR